MNNFENPTSSNEPTSKIEAHVGDTVAGVAFERSKEGNHTGNDEYGNTYEIVEGTVPEDGYDFFSADVKILEKTEDPNDPEKYIFKVSFPEGAGQ